MTGSFASRTESGMSSKGCPNHFGTPPTGRSFTCSMNQSRRLPTHFPKQTPCQVPTVSISVGRLDHWYTVTERSDGQVVVVVQYVKADT